MLQSVGLLSSLEVGRLRVGSVVPISSSSGSGGLAANGNVLFVAGTVVESSDVVETTAVSKALTLTAVTFITVSGTSPNLVSLPDGKRRGQRKLIVVTNGVASGGTALHIYPDSPGEYSFVELVRHSSTLASPCAALIWDGNVWHVINTSFNTDIL